MLYGLFWISFGWKAKDSWGGCVHAETERWDQYQPNWKVFFPALSLIWCELYFSFGFFTQILVCKFSFVLHDGEKYRKQLRKNQEGNALLSENESLSVITNHSFRTLISENESLSVIANHSFRTLNISTSCKTSLNF